jgi:hypothetical protein
MSNPATHRRSATLADKTLPRPTLRAARYECQDCHAHTFLVLRAIGNAKCKVCESYDLAPVED